MKLVYEKTGKEVKIGDLCTLNRGELVKVVGITKPHKPSSTGRVTVEFANDDGSFAGDQWGYVEYYPSVIEAHWIDREDQR